MARRRPKKLRTAKKGRRGVEMKGYAEAHNFVNVFRDQVIRISEAKIGEVARGFSKLVREIIRQQKYRLKPLSKSYLAYKKRAKLDPRILIATNTYVNKIRAFPVRKGGKTVAYRVGVPAGKHEPSGMTYNELARLHEFGSKNKKIPARPVWRPAWSAFRRSASKTVKKARAAALRKARKRRKT